MNHREVHPDEAIDRVLTGLHEVDPPQGMQQRVLQAARERATAQRHRSWQLPSPARHSWAIASATFALIALGASWTLARSHRATQIATHSPAHSAPAVAPVAEARHASTPVARPHLHNVAEPSRSPIEEHSTGLSLPVESSNDEDSLALSEMNAPSTPAPPMPLTEQEKLLARILRKGDPDELAMLDPEVRNSEQTGDNADFERFFKQPPKIIEIKLPLNNKHLTGDEK